MCSLIAANDFYNIDGFRLYSASLHRSLMGVGAIILSRLLLRPWPTAQMQKMW